MKITFWGVRGSIPTPGKDTVRYGGNTSCIEITGSGGNIIVFDAGTGIRGLGEQLVSKSPMEINIFFSHTHWDHTHGFPFFIPAYIPTNTINIFGPPHFDMTMQDIMTRQMEYDFFPVRAAELRAKINYRDIKEETIVLGELIVKSKLMNHPVTCYGYRVEEPGKSVMYTGDHEPYYNFINVEGGDETDKEEIDLIVKEQNERTVNFIKGVDVLIADSQYLEEEYPSKIGWGHSTILQTLDLALRAEVKHLVLFHHEPTRSDDKMDSLLQTTLEKYAELGHKGMKISAAIEGEEILL